MLSNLNHNYTCLVTFCEDDMSPFFLRSHNILLVSMHSKNTKNIRLYIKKFFVLNTLILIIILEGKATCSLHRMSPKK
jgi:hypothetical protein